MTEAATHSSTSLGRAQSLQVWDVLVVGGGHAGCEAANASARMGCRTALLTFDPTRIGTLSCNPAMGGLAKGQLIKEIDALGGIMGRITDLTAIQYRQLNSSKGPAVRSSRAQCDKRRYATEMQRFLAGVPNLTVIEAEAQGLLCAGGRVTGIQLKTTEEIRSQAVVITSGTFLRAIMHTGFEQSEGGRVGEVAAKGLSGSLEALGFVLRRLKTGTPPRLHQRSIDYSKLERQPGDPRPVPFSFHSVPDPFPYLRQVECWITYTNKRTHQLIEDNEDRSPLFTGIIQGVGPRYCPSVEDKVRRFRDKERHQIFLEPEGLDVPEIYANGISTSLPRDVQEAFVRSIQGLEHAEFIRYGYAVEYDAVDARQLRATLGSKDIAGLFFAGQVNGTSGYEEAGAQGLVAGINAALEVQGKDPFIVSRQEGYIGVLVDDLITKGADEPYRMFTSRAEYRLLLREDNADLRLSEKGRNLGLLEDSAYAKVHDRANQIEAWRQKLRLTFFRPDEKVNSGLAALGESLLKDRVSGEVMLKRPNIGWEELCQLGFEGDGVEDRVREQVEIQVKYEGYIRRDLEIWEGVRKNDSLKIPDAVIFDEVPGLSNEIRGKLRITRPETIGQASRMPGITPAALANLMIYLRMLHGRRETQAGKAATGRGCE